MALLSQILAASVVRGEKGPTATVDLGTVTTRLPNQSPTVTNTGSIGSAVFAFGIPRAPTLTMGAVTTIVPSGTLAASITTNGSGDNTLALSIPRARNISIGAITTLSPGASATVTPTTDSNGDITLAMALPQGAPGSINSVGNHVLPTINNTYDLGSAALRFRNIYVNDLQLSNGIGNYTIVEGEEDLFLYNNKNGKVYKFMIQEVEPSSAPAKSNTE